jgi:hypothetical protein
MDEVEIQRLKHEKNVWRGIALGLVVTLILLLAFGFVGAVFLTKASRMRAMEAMELERMHRLEAEQAIRAAQQKK